MRKIELPIVLGKRIRLSAARITLSDFCFFSREVTKVTIARDISVAAILDAYRASPRPLSWAAIFIRAFALTALEYPQLRRVYIKWPFAHMCEYPSNVASIAVERVEAGKNILLFGKIHRPETLALDQIVDAIHRFKTAPLEELADFRLQNSVAYLPRPIRYLLWWLGLNISAIRSGIFGTFGFSTVAGLGADIEYFVQPVGFVFTCGPIWKDTRMTVRLSFDHRVIDGADVARALKDFEDILNGDVATQLRSQTDSMKASAS